MSTDYGVACRKCKKCMHLSISSGSRHALGMGVLASAVLDMDTAYHARVARFISYHVENCKDVFVAVSDPDLDEYDDVTDDADDAPDLAVCRASEGDGKTEVAKD